MGAEDIAKLEKYVKDAKKIKEQLQKLRKWLPQGKGEAPVEVEQIPHKYLEYLKAKAATQPSVKVLAKRVLADKVNIPSELFGNSRIVMANLSDAPEALGEPVTLELKSNDTPAALKVCWSCLAKVSSPRLMSAPAQKALPAPVSTTALIESSLSQVR